MNQWHPVHTPGAHTHAYTQRTHSCIHMHVQHTTHSTQHTAHWFNVNPGALPQTVLHGLAPTRACAECRYELARYLTPQPPLCQLAHGLRCIFTHFMTSTIPCHPFMQSKIPCSAAIPYTMGPICKPRIAAYPPPHHHHTHTHTGYVAMAVTGVK